MERIFKRAVPVWAAGKEEEMNYFLIAKARPDCFRGRVTVRIACCTAYHLRVNGSFAAYGPARCGEGFFRVDENDVTKLIKPGENDIEIIVAGYNQPSYEYASLQKSFLCAEIECGERIVASTGVDSTGVDPTGVDSTGTASADAGGFTYGHFKGLAQRVHRYTYQRCFSEYHIMPEASEPVEVERTEEKRFVPRRIAQSVYSFERAGESVDRGTAEYVKAADGGEYPWAIKCVVSGEFPGYKPEEYDAYPGLEIASAILSSTDATRRCTDVVRLENGYETLKLRNDQTGLVHMRATVKNPAKIILIFAEYQKNDFPKISFSMQSRGFATVVWQLDAGTHELMSFEPYSMQYMQIIAFGGECVIDNIGVVTVGHRPVAVTMNTGDPDLRDITAAAVNTFRQNVLDIFMDCPSRERAGWLCDSFFTSRVEYLLTGGNDTEYNFLENFLLPDGYRNIPDGMLPMCYPSDHVKGNYIPNWAMFFVLEVEEHKRRNPGSDIPDRAKEKIYKLLKFFEKYENSDGLLEKLERWVFVEWSHANELVQDVNYPTNMLYSMMLRAVYRLYGDEKALKKSRAVAETVRKQSFNGSFFCDNAVRKDGVLTPSGEVTEVCQYYAFFTGTATKESYPELFDTLIRDFGPSRASTGKYPEVWPANAFVGNYLRLEIMMNEGFKDEAVNDMKAFFKPMTELTGTLWENMTPSASCNHGFASHVLVWLARAGLIGCGGNIPE